MPDDRIICTVHELNTYDWECLIRQSLNQQCLRPQREMVQRHIRYYVDKPDMDKVVQIARRYNVDLGVAFDMCYEYGRYDDEIIRRAILDYYKSIGVTFDD